MRSIYLLERHRRALGEATIDFLPVDPDKTSPAPHCHACGQPVGMRRWEPPFRGEIETWGSRFGDLAFGPGDEFLVSERFAALWKRERLLGLHGFAPVEVVKVRYRGKRIKEAPPHYLCVRAERSEVTADHVRSGIQWVSPPTCEVCRVGTMKGQERIVLEGQPKENVLIARGLPGQVLVDERFKRFCEEHAITNCSLIPAEEASYRA
jgi:hypothetical protein